MKTDENCVRRPLPSQADCLDVWHCDSNSRPSGRRSIEPAQSGRQELKSASASALFSNQVIDARRFYLELRPTLTARLFVVSGGVERCKPDYVLERSTFPHFGVEYVARGRGEVLLAGKRHAIGPGCLICYDPNTPHRVVGDNNDPLIKYFVVFSGEQAGDLLRLGDLSPGAVAHVFPPDTLSSLFDELISTGSGGHRDSADLCAKLLECILLKAKSMRAPTDTKETVAFARFVECRAYIQQHFVRLRTLEQIAEECHVSTTHLCHLFQRYETQTPYQYLTRLKMSFAAEQIQHGALVKQAADLIGYGDPFHFSRVFRKKLGLSPDKWRLMQRESLAN